MFSTRHNQENLTHLHQTAAAAKPLNQTTARTPAPKTHGPKTPFRNRNDENATATQLKTAGGKPAANLFATPAPSKPRAVLGAKTTNAKALQTPGLRTNQKPLAPPPSTQKVSPRLRRARVKIHQPSPSANVDSDSDSAPEVEYCPPPRLRTPPLPNYPDDIHELPLDQLFSRQSLLAASPEAYRPSQARLDAEREKRLKELDARAAEALSLHNLRFSSPDLEAARREAVGALAAPTPATTAPAVPRFAAPTAAATARSRTTVGYSRGRQVSATKRPPLSSAHRAGVVRAKPTETRKVVADDEERDEAFERLVREDFVLEL